MHDLPKIGIDALLPSLRKAGVVEHMDTGLIEQRQKLAMQQRLSLVVQLDHQLADGGQLLTRGETIG